MLDSDRTLLKAAIARVEFLHPTIRTADLDGWLDHVVYLCRLKQPDFGRKRNPSGRISPNTLGIRFGDQGHFIGVDVARDGPNTLRPDWIIYDDLGPHVDQRWEPQRIDYVDTRWENQPPPPPEPPPEPLIDLSAVYGKLDVLISMQQETHAAILALEDRLRMQIADLAHELTVVQERAALAASYAFEARNNAHDAKVEALNAAVRALAIVNHLQISTEGP